MCGDGAALTHQTTDSVTSWSPHVIGHNAVVATLDPARHSLTLSDEGKTLRGGEGRKLVRKIELWACWPEEAVPDTNWALGAVRSGWETYIKPTLGLPSSSTHGRRSGCLRITRKGRSPFTIPPQVSHVLVHRSFTLTKKNPVNLVKLWTNPKYVSSSPDTSHLNWPDGGSFFRRNTK